MPSGVGAGEGRPATRSSALAYINEMIGPEVQAKLVGRHLLAAHQQGHAGAAAGHADQRHACSASTGKFVADNRADWVKRWDRDMAM